MITPEPICWPCEVVTFSSTTDGSILAIAASCCVCGIASVYDGDLVAEVVLALRLPPANCQPANRPTPKITASTSASSTIAPERRGRFGGDGGASTGSGG